PNRDAVALPAGSVERDQFPDQHGSLGLAVGAQVARDARDRPFVPDRFPRLFEGVAAGIDAGRLFGQELLVLGRRLEGHGWTPFSSCFHSRRMRATLRSTVRGTQSSRAAISSLV